MRVPRFALEDHFARYKASCAHNLTSSDVQAVTVEELLHSADEEVRELWRTATLAYGASRGHPLLRAEVASSHRTVEDPDAVHVFSGATEAIFALVNVLVDPGEHAVVLGPAYQLLTDLPRAAGAEVTQVDLRAEDGWHLDVDRVRQALTARTRLVIANFPNNPTGALADPAAFGELVELVGSVGATLISDELYRGLELGGPEAALPAGVDLAPHVVSVAGVSKVYGLPGARIGWAVSHDRRLMDDLRTYRYWTSLSNSVLSELLALAALRSGEALLARGRVIVQDNLVALNQFMDDHGALFDWVPPRAGTTTFPALRRGSASALAQRLAEQHSIFLAPASVLLARGEHLRFGLGRTGFTAGLSALSEALAAPDVLGEIG